MVRPSLTLCGLVIWGQTLAGVAASVPPDPGSPSTLPATAPGADALRDETGPAEAGAEMYSLERVLAIGLPVSADLERAQGRVARDQALVRLGIASRLPQLSALASGSFTQVGTSVGVITNLPTLGDISLGLRQDGYAQFQNTFGNLGLVLDLNLLPLRQTAELSAFRAGLTSSRAALGETERQVRFDLVSAYRDLQLRQELIPVWEKALEASTALERDAEAIRRRGLAARVDVLRSRALRARDVQGLAEARAELGRGRQHLAALLGLPPERAPLASEPLRPQPPWPLSLEDSLERALKDRPLLASLRAQQRAQSSLAKAARSVMLPSLSLVVGGGLSGDRLAAPVISGSASLDSSEGSLGLPSLRQSGVASGSFYNWGAALLLRQPLYDGGRGQSGAAVAERERDLLAADTDLARRRIRDTVSASWSSLQSSESVLKAARAGVEAGERALRDAQLRYRALVEPLTEVLLVQRDLQAARASLLTALARQAIERAVMERETGITGLDPVKPEAKTVDASHGDPLAPIDSPRAAVD